MQALRIRVRGEPADELAVIAQRAQAFTNASGTAIALREGNADEIICRARAGSSAPEVGTALLVEGTFTGLCIQSGQELRCDDAETDTRADKAAIRALGIRSMVAIPIKEEGRVVGVLAVFAPTTYAFTITHVVLLKTIADQVAAYLRRKRQGEAASFQPLPASPGKAMAVSAASPPIPLPAVAIKPEKPALTDQPPPAKPKVEPVPAGTFAEEINPAFCDKKNKPNSHGEQQQPETDFRAAFRTLDAAAAHEKRPRAIILIIGAAAVVVIAVAIGLSFKLRGSTPVPQPASETSTSPDARVTSGPDSTNVQPSPKNSPSALLEKDEEAQLKREGTQSRYVATVVLSERPSRISRVRDNAASTSEAPAISLGSVPASGSLSNLISSVSPHPRFLMQSALEPVTVIKKVPPLYPLVAKQQRLSGSVVVQGTVNKNGRIRDLQLISGQPLFRDAAFAAVKQWVFKPARLNGQTIEQPTQIRLDFGAH